MNATRSRVRLAHIGMPPFDPETVRMLLRLAILPGLTSSGAVLWALPKLRRIARRGTPPGR